MTDGIIQEVFKSICKQYSKYIDEHHCYGILLRTQTELIEKIKQEFDGKDSLNFQPRTPSGAYHRIQIIRKLIGDNQE